MGLLDLIGGGTPGIGVGDPAPDFALPDRSGRTVRLGDYRGKKAVVLYFYPKDDTPGCTKEACSFRDQYQDFQDAGAEVIGVSSDAEAAHEKFAAKYKLPFVLLADRRGARHPSSHDESGTLPRPDTAPRGCAGRARGRAGSRPGDLRRRVLLVHA